MSNSFQLSDQIFVKGYGFFTFTKDMGRSSGRSSGKNIIKTLSSEYSQELLDHGKQSVTDSLKATSQKAIQKTAEATTDSIRTEIVDRITKVSKHFQQNN